MEDKKIWAILLIALFGGNLTGISGIVGNHANREGHEELQRQLDDIKENDAELRASLQEHLSEYSEHVRWGREIRANNEGTIQRHEAQIQELRRYLK